MHRSPRGVLFCTISWQPIMDCSERKLAVGAFFIRNSPRFGLDRWHLGAYIATLMLRPCPGQRWISTSDPALGLGVVLEFDGGRVTMHFPAVEAKRAYALESAPLLRVRFEPGDVVVSRDMHEITVSEVIDDA